jgi:hypothetical protein
LVRTWIELGWKNLEKLKAVQNVEKKLVRSVARRISVGCGGFG